MPSNKNRIEIKLAKQRIINEVQKYAAQKKLLELPYIYIASSEMLQNKSLDELVVIYNKSLECLHKYTDQLMMIKDYTVLVRHTICSKYKV